MARRSTAPTYNPTQYAVLDTYAYTESTVPTGPVANTITLDVLVNDGSARKRGTNSLYSVDDGPSGSGDTPTNLLSPDATHLEGGHVVSDWEFTSGGNLVRLYDGKLQLDYSYWLAGRTLDSLTATDVLNDSFAYAVKLADGSLNWTTVSFQITGENDPAQVFNAGQYATYTSVTDPTTIPGPTLSVVDPDAGQADFSAYSTDTHWGSFIVAYDPDAKVIDWTYLRDTSLTLPFDYNNDRFVERLTVMTVDGTQANVDVVLLDRALRTDAETYNATAASDLIYAGPGANNLEAGLGNDTVYAGEGSDNVNGGEGNDRLYGQAGNDYLGGSDGDDFLSSGGGFDFLDGGFGNDTYAIDMAAGALGSETAVIVRFMSALLFHFEHDVLQLSTAAGSAFAPLAGQEGIAVSGGYVTFDAVDASNAWISVDLDGAGGPLSPVHLALVQHDGVALVGLSDADVVLTSV